MAAPGGFRKAACSECASSFNLIPPADEEYDSPSEKPRGEDYIKRVYECELNHHPNTIYWIRRAPSKTRKTRRARSSSFDY